MSSEKKLLKTIKGNFFKIPPIWFMRQAGRHLPEYLEVRASESSILDLCYHKEKAKEVSLQPYRRYGMDGVIVFSDILVVPHAMGQKVEFIQNEGPRLEAITSTEELHSTLKNQSFDQLHIVGEILNSIKQDISPSTSLLGFSGAPWTLATYMIQGKSSKDFVDTKFIIYQNPEFVDELFALLVDWIKKYLTMQIQAGADIVQIFDSWAGSLPYDLFEKYCIKPTQEIVSYLRDHHPETGIICFPKGIGLHYQEFIDKVQPDAVSIDSSMSLSWVRENLQSKCAIQGNLDPALLVAGGDKMFAQADHILNELKGKPFIFNLGHGIDKRTSPENVLGLVNYVRGKENV